MKLPFTQLIQKLLLRRANVMYVTSGCYLHLRQTFVLKPSPEHQSVGQFIYIKILLLLHTKLFSPFVKLNYLSFQYLFHQLFTDNVYS